MPWTLDSIHPLFIHFPIALLSTGLIFDILSLIFNYEEFETTGFLLLLIGAISCIFANVTGILAFLSMGSLSDVINFNHGILSLSTTLFFLVIVIIRIKFELDIQYNMTKKYFYIIIHIIAVMLLFYSSHMGAKIAERI